MAAYILRRLLLIIPTLLGIMIINFVLVQFVPGGPIEQIIAQIEGQGDVFGGIAGASETPEAGNVTPGNESYAGARGLPPEFIEELERQFGFDKPPLERFLDMMWNYIRLDFGESYFRSIGVIDLVLEKMPVSISLGLWSTLIAYLVSIPLGIRKAVKDGTSFDTWTSGVIIVAYAIPGFLFAILLLVLFAGGSYLQIFPIRGLVSDNWEDLNIFMKVVDYFWHIALPIFASTISAFATLTLLTKNSFLDEIKKQYVITARNMNLEINSKYIEPGYTATDNYDGDISDRVIVDSNLDVTEVGNYTITYRVEDSYENRYSITRNIKVEDTIAPEITLLGDNPLNWGLGWEYEDPGIMIEDNSGEDLSDIVVTESNIDIDKLGSYEISFSVTDSEGNISDTVTRQVNIVEINTFRDLGKKYNYIHRGETFEDPGVIAIMNDLSENTTDIHVTNTLQVRPGTYSITYKFIGNNEVPIEDYVRYVKVLETGQIPYKEENPFSWDEQYLYGDELKTREDVAKDFIENEFKALNIGQYPIDVIPDIGYPDSVKESLVSFNRKRNTSVLLLNENKITHTLNINDIDLISSYNDDKVFRFFQHVLHNGTYRPMSLEVLSILRKFSDFGMKTSITESPTGDISSRPIPTVIRNQESEILDKGRVNYAIKSSSGFRLETEKADVRNLNSRRYFLYNTIILNRLISDMLLYLETSRHIKNGVTNEKRAIKSDMKNIVDSYSSLLQDIKYKMISRDGYIEHVILAKFSTKGRYHNITISTSN